MDKAQIHILITGGAGQVGTELLRAAWPVNVQLHAPDRSLLDLSDPESVAAVFETVQFAAVINPAAYTAVDKAEDEAGVAFAANATGPALLADATRKAGVPLIHVSTDYVFDGSQPGFYSESDPVAPLGVYGASKLAGELAVRSGNPRSVVLRTAWVFSAHRSNFVKTMLRVGATNPELRVVNDQFGCPTSAADIAETLMTITLRLIDDPDAPTGVYQFVNAGEASWHGFAQAIFEASELRPIVTGIPTAEYPTRARRPANSRMSTAKLGKDFSVNPRPWPAALHDVIADLKQETSR